MPRILNAAAASAVIALVGGLLSAAPVFAAEHDGVAAGTITGTVRGVLAEAFEGACVTVSADEDGDGIWTAVGEPTTTAADGSYTVAELAPGAYAVAADGCEDVSFETTWYRSGLTRPVTVEEGLVIIADGGSATNVDIQLIAAAIQNLSAPTVAGLPVVGAELTAGPGTWSLDGLAFEFQWSADGAPIDAATGPAFAVTADQLGAAISVAVRATRPGFDPVTVVSTATGPIVAGTLPEFSAEITGDAKVGSTLMTVLPASAGVAVTWNRDGAPIDGAVEATYVPTVDDLGAIISVTITQSVAGYATRSATSAATAPVAEGDLPAYAPAISGAAAVGATLSVAVPSVGDISVQWLRNDAPITDAVGTSYVLAPSDLGASITVTVTQVVAGYVPRTVMSDATAPVALGTQLAFTPLVSGTVVVGKTLSASVPAGPVYSYQWLRNGVSISGATSSTYPVVPADLGTQLTVGVIAKVAGYSDRTAYSASTVKVAPGTLASFTPVVTGTPIVGSTLSITVPAGNSYRYQWLRNGAKITGATASTYRLVTADAGTKVSVTVVASRTGYTSLTRTSAATATVLRALTAAPTPTISGTRKVGQLLSAVPGTWSPAPVTLRYQWYRSGVAITGATSSTYRAAAADLGKSLSVVVTGSKSGYATVARKSGGTAAIAAGTIAISTPTVSGTVRVGYTLTANATVAPSSSTLRYQWYRAGVAITTATTSTYKLTTSDYGKSISVRITASRLAYTTTARASGVTPAVGPGSMSGPVPTITGTARLGYTLNAVAGTWPSGTTLKYQWRANGVAISGATKSSLFLNSGSLSGKRITVIVTGSRYAYSPLTRTSGSTVAVVVPGSTSPVADWTCPSWAPIKGNESSMIYHMPGQRYYDATNPEVCFSTESAAVNAGYRKAKV
ncbi:hypothetical protein PX701_15510 [Agromyces sp. H3Y2-19a]|uniref:sunset domain-containing protein n=1 Tax=Agromyces chromiiresistens TaxID=3030835 RepID=UPI0023B925AB|nr:hypothetical protein [Agromyces chromiiresistens]MDF0515040.1 hypothetical protein [Agromyces chromiiresistens]